MATLNKTQTLELLKQGATIEFTTWGPSAFGGINLFLGPEHKGYVHANSFNALSHADLIYCFKRERLTQYWKLKLSLDNNQIKEVKQE